MKIDGEKLRRLRVRAGLSPEALGGVAGLAGSTIRSYEIRSPHASTLKKLADALGVEVDDLIDDGDRETAAA